MLTSGPMSIKLYRKLLSGESVDPIWDTLVHGYKLDETSGDFVDIVAADQWDMTRYGSPGSDTGLFGNAMVASTSNAAFKNSTHLHWGMTASGIKCVSVWFYPTAPSGFQYVATSQSSFEGGWETFVSGTTAFAAIRGTVALRSANLGTVNTNQWNHIALWYQSGTRACRGTLNGAASVASADPGDLPASVSDANGAIGNQAVSFFFIGRIDELMIFSAQDDYELWADNMYNGGAGRSYPN